MEIGVRNPDENFDKIGAVQKYSRDPGIENKENPVDFKLTSDDFFAGLDSGHFVATYKKDMFNEIVTYIGFKMGGLSEDYLDQCPLKKDYWRLTTYDNFAYHMGNVYEAWMDQMEHSYDHTYQFSCNFPTYPTISRAEYLFKSKFLKMIFKSRKVRMLFFRFKKMPKNMVRRY